MAAKPITLNVREVALAAKAAYDEGRLSAQNGGLCKYRSGGFPCAIGAALDDRTARRFDNRENSAIPALVQDGLVVTDDVAALKRLQLSHDSWATFVGNKRSFVRTLNSILKQSGAV